MNIDACKIEIEMAERRLSRKELSNRSGVSPQHLSTILLRGTCTPKTAGKLAVGLGVDVKDIIETKEA